MESQLVLINSIICTYSMAAQKQLTGAVVSSFDVRCSMPPVLGEDLTIGFELQHDIWFISLISSLSNEKFRLMITHDKQKHIMSKIRHYRLN